MLTPFDESMLRRAMRVAMNGRGRVEPNPMVGCVLVQNQTVIAEGHHTHFGGPHAEPAALADCQSRGTDPRGATAYVTLEPCCHTNKKTPPCAPRLIEAGVARVVIGCLDPNADVDGKGVAMLRAAGITVDAAPPALAAEFLQLIAPFRTPPFYMTVKWAESADGFVAGAGGMPVRITGPAADQAVHRLRTRCDAIAVGIGTVLMDDPALTIRGVEVIRRPTRIVLDRGLRTPLTSRLLTTAGPAETGQPVVILTDAAMFETPRLLAETDQAEVWTDGQPVKVEHLRQRGVRVEAYETESLPAALAEHVPGGSHLLIEPGPTLAESVLPWADRLWLFRSDQPIAAGESGPRARPVPASYVEIGRLRLGSDTLIEYLNRDTASFAAAVPSADFVLERERLPVPFPGTPG